MIIYKDDPDQAEAKYEASNDDIRKVSRRTLHL